eukprot:g6325.t1
MLNTLQYEKNESANKNGSPPPNTVESIIDDPSSFSMDLRPRSGSVSAPPTPQRVVNLRTSSSWDELKGDGSGVPPRSVQSFNTRRFVESLDLTAETQYKSPCESVVRTSRSTSSLPGGRSWRATVLGVTAEEEAVAEKAKMKEKAHQETSEQGKTSKVGLNRKGRKTKVNKSKISKRKKGLEKVSGEVYNTGKRNHERKQTGNRHYSQNGEVMYRQRMGEWHHHGGIPLWNRGAAAAAAAAAMQAAQASRAAALGWPQQRFITDVNTFLGMQQQQQQMQQLLQQVVAPQHALAREILAAVQRIVDPPSGSVIYTKSDAKIIIGKVAEVIGELYENSNPIVFGSFSSGLFLPGASDVDMAIDMSKEREGAPIGRSESLEVLRAVMAVLQGKDWVHHAKLIEGTAVPVVKLKTKNSIPIDISVVGSGVHSGIRGTNFVSGLLKQRPALLSLVLVVKRFLLSLYHFSYFCYYSLLPNRLCLPEPYLFPSTTALCLLKSPLLVQFPSF